MNQYCRYCVNCFVDKGIFVCYHNMTIKSEAAIKRRNNCPNFLYSDSGDVITGEPYSQVRKAKQKQMQTNFLSLMEDK